MASNRESQIAQALVAQGKVSPAQIAAAQETAERSGISLIAALIRSGHVTTSDLADVAETVGEDPEPETPHEQAQPEPPGPAPSAAAGAPGRGPRTLRPTKSSLESYNVDPEALREVPKVLAEEHRVLPLEISEQRLVVAMADKTDVFALDAIRARTGRRVEAIEVDPQELMAAIDRYYAQAAVAQVNTAATAKRLDTHVAEQLDSFGPGTDRSLADVVDQGVTVQIVQKLLAEAIRQRASDIHIEPGAQDFRVRYRVDGRMMEQARLDMDMHAPVVSRIKILADCDISETRLPQDGRFATSIEDTIVDLRVSTLPTFWGEKVVMRLLDRSRVLVSLTQLGFSPEVLRDFEKLIRMPQGMILVTGPTGSGKSTTLYSALHAINDETRNITTVEDPIEYEVANITQTQVNPRIDLTFARALRHILRQDPDVILVGESRDLETAKITFQTSLTRHLVLTTLHTNDAPSAATRLIDIGIEPYIIASSLIGVLAQRLVRRICTHCRETCMPTEVELERLQLSPEQAKKIQFHKGRGCTRCRNTGYSGRVALYELMVMNNELRDAITSGATGAQVRQIALRTGMKSLKYDGLLKINQGITSAQEVIRVSYDPSDQ